jgi:signal transduction histidine kinase
MQETSQDHKIEMVLDETRLISGDRNRIGQVITNLISNALKYSPDASKIVVSTFSSETEMKFCVKDFGIGIPTSQQKDIFNRFFRVSGKKLHTFPGLGLGLFISSEIMKRHGGTITVNSREGEGSEFCCTLPVGKMFGSNSYY